MVQWQILFLMEIGIFLLYYNFTSQVFATLLSRFSLLLILQLLMNLFGLHHHLVLHGRVLSEDLLQRRGIALASRCSLCCKNVESVEHIFFNCSFASAIWLFLLHKFELGAFPSSLLNVYNCGLHTGRSAQLKELWMVAFTTALWFIWNSRNKVRFDGVVVHATNVFGMIVGHIQASSRLVTGVMHNSILDLRVLKCFGASCNPRSAPRVLEVNWRPPPSGWVKVNTDGAWRRGLGVGGYGGVFRNDQGCFIGALSSSLDIPS